MTELFAHSWPPKWPMYAALEKRERAAYEDAILKEIDGLHKVAAQEHTDAKGCEATAEECERAAQLTAQTAPVTERKHFYRTARSTRKVQDVLLATDDSMEDVNGAFVLGAACAVMQTTAARCGMLTKDSYDGKSVRWWMRTRCACSTDRNKTLTS